MKQQFILFCFPMILIFHPLKSLAQYAGPEPLPGWVSEKGYWQVETNIRSPWDYTIYFYNNDKVLVYKAVSYTHLCMVRPIRSAVRRN